MSTKQLKDQLIALQEMLEDMKQERIEASAIYPESHWMIKDIDEDILLCSLTINDIQIELTINR